MRRSPLSTRAEMVKRIEARLRNSSFPRVQMLLLVALTGACGLLASFILLHLGLDTMAVRYPLALVVAYLFFLLLIWFWLRTNARDYLDFLDPAVFVTSGGPSAGSGNFTGGGGDSGGGGASASFDSPSTDLGSALDAPTESVGEVMGSVGDADELVVPVAVIALAIGLALASLYVVYIAPALFAEVLVDGALSYVLFRRLRAQERQFWLATAMRRTIVPFAVTAAFLAVVGVVMSFYAPGATSVGQVIEYATAGGSER